MVNRRPAVEHPGFVLEGLETPFEALGDVQRPAGLQRQQDKARYSFSDGFKRCREVSCERPGVLHGVESWVGGNFLKPGSGAGSDLLFGVPGAQFEDGFAEAGGEEGFRLPAEGLPRAFKGPLALAAVPCGETGGV